MSRNHVGRHYTTVHVKMSCMTRAQFAAMMILCEYAWQFHYQQDPRHQYPANFQSLSGALCRLHMGNPIAGGL